MFWMFQPSFGMFCLSRPLFSLSRTLAQVLACLDFVYFSIKFGHVLSLSILASHFSTSSNVLDIYFNCARPMFWLCSTYASIFSIKDGYLSTVFELCFEFFNQILACFVFLDHFSSCLGFLDFPDQVLASLYFIYFSIKFGHVLSLSTLASNFSTSSNLLDIYFDCARHKFWQCSTYVLFYWSEMGICRLFLTYVLNFLFKFWHVSSFSTTFHLVSSFLIFPIKFWHVFILSISRSSLGMSWVYLFWHQILARLLICSTYILTVPDISFDSARPMFYFIDHKWVFVDCFWPMFWIFYPNFGLFCLFDRFSACLKFLENFLDQVFVCLSRSNFYMSWFLWYISAFSIKF